MISQSHCPNAQVLSQFRLGQIVEADAETIIQHLAECPACVNTLENIKTNDTVLEALQKASATMQTPVNQDVEKLMDRLCKLSSAGEITQGEQTRDDTPSSAAETGADEAVDFLAPPQSVDELGRLGNYRVLKVLGAGGMGSVFLAEDISLKRAVALKTMQPSLAASKSARDRFIREAQSMAAVKHDNVATIYQVGEDRGVPFLAMELLEGEPLDKCLQREGALSVEETLRIGKEIARGLAAAHRRGLLHRDIKPANVWLERMDEPQRHRDTETEPAKQQEQPIPSSLCLGASVVRSRVKILDFGLARAVGQESQLTQQGAIVGTPAYMAPEQGRGETVDARTDLFSLGCVLYRAATGRNPFKGKDTVSTLMSVANDHPTPPCEVKPEVPVAVSDYILKLLSKSPADRPASADAVAGALETLAGVAIPTASVKVPSTEYSVLSTQSAPTAAGGRTSRRLLVAAAVLLALLGGGAFGVYQIIFNTPNGRIVVEIDSEQVEARFQKGKLELYDANGKLKYTLTASEREKAIPPGEYGVKVAGVEALRLKVTGADGAEFETNKFELKRDGKVIVRVLLEPAVVAHAGERTAATLPALVYLEDLNETSSVGMWPWRKPGKDPNGTEVLGGPFPGESPKRALLGHLKRVSPKVIEARIVYELGGQYETFQTVAKSSPRRTDRLTVEIFGDGKSLAKTVDVSKVKDVGAPLNVDIRGVRKLSIVANGEVTSDFGHVLLIEPRLTRVIATQPTDSSAGPVLEFTGSSLITIPTLPYNGGPITVELTQHPTAPVFSSLAMFGKSRILFWGSTTQHGVTIDVEGSTLVAWVDRPPALGRDTRIAASFDGKVLRYFDEGKLVCVGTAVAKPLHRDPGTYIGGQMKASFVGRISEVRVSKGVRYADDYTPVSRFQADKDTLALYHFDEGQGDVLKDSSGNEHHGKIVGAKWVNADGSAIDHDRRVAEWVLSVGGTIEVIVDGKSIRLEPKATVPPGKFRFSSIDLRHLNTIDDAALDNLTGLTLLEHRLTLNGTAITDVGLEKLAKNPALIAIVQLGIGPTSISEAGLVHLRKFRNVAHLGLPATKVTRTWLRQLRELPDLISLDLSQTPLADDDLEELRGLKLEILSLKGCRRIGDTGLVHLRDMTSLRDLALDQTQVRDNGLVHLKGLTNLERLHLVSVKITDGGLSQLEGLTKLKYMELRGTLVTADGVNKLAAARPQCRIESDHGTFGPQAPVADAPGSPDSYGRIASPFDALHRGKIPPEELKLAGGGDASKAPEELVKVLRLQPYEPKGNAARVTSALTSHDLTTVAISGQNSQTWIFDVATGSQRPFGAVNLMPLRFKVDGSRLLSFSQGSNEVYLADLKTEHILTQKRLGPASFAGFAIPVKTAAVFTEKTDVVFLHPDTLVETARFSAGKEPIVGRIVSADGRLLVTGHSTSDRSGENIVRIWDVASGQKKAEFSPGVHVPVSRIRLSEDGQVIFFSHANVANVWRYDLSQKQMLSPIKAEDTIVGMDLHPESWSLATATAPGKVQIWNARTGDLLRTIQLPAPPDAAQTARLVRYVPDGRHLLVGNTADAVFVLRLKDARFGLQTPPVDAPGSANSDRRVAEWILSKNGSVRVLVDGKGSKVLKTATELPPGPFSLTHANLTGTLSTDADLRQLNDLTSLIALDLARTPVTDAGVAQLQRMMGLEHFYASETKLTDAALAKLGEFAELTNVNLIGTEISDVGLKHLEKLSKLQELRLEKTKVTLAGVRQFSAALPKCKIESSHGSFEPKTKSTK